MPAFLGIIWLLAMLLAVVAIFGTVGAHTMVSFFPEGKRWWLPLSQIASLVAFALLSHYTPF